MTKTRPILAPVFDPRAVSFDLRARPAILAYSSDPNAMCPDCGHGPLWHDDPEGCTRMVEGWCRCPHVLEVR